MKINAMFANTTVNNVTVNKVVKTVAIELFTTAITGTLFFGFLKTMFVYYALCLLAFTTSFTTIGIISTIVCGMVEGFVLTLLFVESVVQVFLRVKGVQQ